MNDEILASLEASTARRFFALIVLAILAVLLLRMAMSGAEFWINLLVGAMGLGALSIGWSMYNATARAVHLRRDGLFDSDGTCLATMDMILSVDRGVFAFKPSNGFVLRLARGQGRLWRPGLYWRFGRRLGVGGITRATEAKQMADILAVLLAEREADQEKP
jgi:hypothetical protein